MEWNPILRINSPIWVKLLLFLTSTQLRAAPSCRDVPREHALPPGASPGLGTPPPPTPPLGYGQGEGRLQNPCFPPRWPGSGPLVVSLP